MGTTIEGVIKPCKKYCGFRRMVDAWNVRVTQNVPIKGLIVTGIFYFNQHELKSTNNDL